MADAEWFKWCFDVWRGRAQFSLNNDHPDVDIDVSALIPPKGWVS